MSTRARYQHIAPDAFKALIALEQTLAKPAVGQTIVDLVKIRASQLNGCLFCLDMHSKEARIRGERELRLYHLPLWRESALFTDREKAALAWAEQLTRTDGHGVGDSAYDALATYFTEKEIVDLTFAVTSINAWNRLGIAFQPTPGSADKIYGLDKIDLH